MRPRALLDRLASVARRAGRGFVSHRCLIGASALSYSTILSFLPLTAIVLVVFSDFPIFAGARSRFLLILLGNFAPEVGENATQWFQDVASNAAKTTAIGVIAFAFTSIMLLATIEDQLDDIWDVTTQRTWVQRISAYWLVLTLGPLLLGGSLSVSTYIDHFASIEGIHGIFAEQTIQEWAARVTYFIPFILEFVSLAFLYCVIPNCRVRWRDGMAGALCAAILMEVLKWAFAFYVSQLSSYSLIYGALAGIPIFLLWMYIFWLVLLFGAEIAAGLAPRQLLEIPGRSTQLAIQAELAFGLLVALAENRSQGGTVSTYELSSRLGTSPAIAHKHLTLMQQAGLVAAASDGGWVLTRSLVSLNLSDLYHVLKLPLVGGQPSPCK
jgi:membrane protein